MLDGVAEALAAVDDPPETLGDTMLGPAVGVVLALGSVMLPIDTDADTDVAPIDVEDSTTRPPAGFRAKEIGIQFATCVPFR